MCAYSLAAYSYVMGHVSLYNIRAYVRQQTGLCVMGFKFLIILIISAYSKQVSWSAQCQAAYKRDTI